MTPAAVLAHLADRGGFLAVLEHGTRLRYHGPAYALTPDVRALLERHREALLDLLTRRTFTRDELDELGFLGEPAGGGRFRVPLTPPDNC